MTARDPAVTSAILHDHEDRLTETERIVQELHRGLATTIAPVHIVETEARHVLQVHRTVASDRLWSVDRADRTYPLRHRRGPSPIERASRGTVHISP